jgi:3-dehydroquinate dehydratase-2
MAQSILLINGPNLNLLGLREPHIYGHATLKNVEEDAKSQAASLNITLETFQSNWEGAIIDRIHEARGKVSSKSYTPSSMQADPPPKD